MRLFVAVDLDDPARRAAASALEKVRRAIASVAPRSRIAWVETAQLHVTVRFLGEVDTARLPSVRAALAGPFGVAPFDAALGGAGAFPPSGAPRVIWLGLVEGAASLARLHDLVEERLAALGFPREPRPFHAHVTLGRVREVAGAAGGAIRSVLASHPGGPAARWRIDHLTLYESRLSPRGPQYVPVAVEPLETAPS